MARRPGGNSSSTRGSMRKAGWMHTSSGVDNVDEFVETIETAERQARTIAMASCGGRWATRPVTIRYRTGDGRLAERSFTTYRTHHGPIVRSEGGHWIAIRDDGSAGAGAPAKLSADQGDGPWRRSSSIARLRANSSNNTIFADATGDDRLSARRSSCRGATTASIIPSRSTAAIRRPTGRRFTASSDLPNVIKSAQRLGPEHQ